MPDIYFWIYMAKALACVVAIGGLAGLGIVLSDLEMVDLDPAEGQQ